MKKPYLSVIIPAHNEAKRLPITLIDIDKHLSKVDFDYEIIIVENNSSDATYEAAERFSHVVKNFKVIKCNVPGKGGAVKAGMMEANGEIRIFMDADNATTIDQFSKMIPYFKEGYDIVIGSRDVEGAKLMPPQTWYKRLGGNIGNIIIQILLLPGIWDTQCGFKAFTEKAVKDIFPKIKTFRWGFDVEVLSLAKAMGYKMKEIPVVWVDNPFSQVKASAYIQVLLEVFKIRWWLTSNQYKLNKR